MKRIAILILAAALMASGAAWAQSQASSKIGVFDAQRISEETAEGKRIQSKLNGFRDKKQAEIVEKEKAVQALQDKLQAQTLSLSPDKRGELEKEIQKKALELNQVREAAQREMQMEVAEAENGFREKLLAVVESFGRDEGFAVIVERSLVAYVNPAMDVTTAIVDRFNKLVPAESPAEPAAAPAKPAADQAAPGTGGTAPSPPEKK